MSLLEVVDPETGEHVEPGEEGEVVVTFLESEASPLLRFASGDKARWLGWDCCECGRAFPALESGTISRYDDMLKVKGVSFWPAAVDALVFAQQVRDYRGRVYVDDAGRERVEVTVAAGRDVDLRRLAGELRERIGVAVDVRAGDVDADAFRDERTKARRWRDERAR
jgi:phenylacetate-CoA ligase